MSEIAGRITPQIGAHYLQRPSGGRGILLGGSTGVRPGRVVILGCGIVGSAAARMSSGLGARVVVIDRDLDRLRRLEEASLRGVTTLAASSMAIRNAVLNADLLIGAILVVGSRTPALVDRRTVEGMKAGSVIVDVDVDNGGCVETSRPTTLEDPTFVEAGVIHYCVKNVPPPSPSPPRERSRTRCSPTCERWPDAGSRTPSTRTRGSAAASSSPRDASWTPSSPAPLGPSTTPSPLCCRSTRRPGDPG